MRAGTQTLIQALQALPWAHDPDNDDDAINHDLVESDSDEDKQDQPLASSIHTIYRPVALSRRAESRSQLSPVSSHSGDEDDVSRDVAELAALSDEPIEEDDFEVSTPGAVSPVGYRQEEFVRPGLSPVLEHVARSGALRTHSARKSSTATVKTIKLDRRARLAAKLADIFDLNGITEVIAEMPCWLLRSILLQGQIFLTNSYLCFFAHMPAREDQVLKSGSLYKKAQRTKRWIKHWFILKNDVLSWYQSSSDPYFPHGVVDLRYAISCDPANEKDIRLRTNAKTIHLSADSVPSREEWVKAIRKVIFKAQNMGDTVKIAIPYSTILDVDKSYAMDFTETIEVKVVDGSDDLSVDSYFFAYFHDMGAALEQIRDAVSASRHILPEGTEQPALELIDTTASRPSPIPRVGDERTHSAPEGLPKASSTFRLSSLLRHTLPIGRSASVQENLDASEDFTYVQKRDNSSFIPITASPTSETPPLPPDSRMTASPTGDLAHSHGSLTPTPSHVGHTYPPSTSPNELFLSPTRESSLPSWNVSVPSWLKIPTRRSLLFSGGAGAAHASTLPVDGKAITEVYSSTTSSQTSNAPGELGFSILETPDNTVDVETSEKFKAAFAFDNKETLLGYFSGYIFRLLPVYGRLYVSTNYLCFKNSGPLASRTRLILPIRDILSTEISKAFRFAHYGLIVIIKGYEELFLEFGQQDRRAAFVRILNRQIEDVRRRDARGEPVTPSQGQRDALILEEFVSKTTSREDSDPPPAPETMTNSLPAVMFTSTSSTFLTFKPKNPLRFTFLTIGSRGDVQPYIALAKGLMADGHHVKIATHGEFQSWVESYGIEFGYVGGDPTELMRICVENGTFTVSFLREGMQKFRGWIDDLLKTAWEACRDTDVLIESPSAMAGYHIAEALRIPYFKAFTMTWSRTRAYPHAFAVPERKMGGSYNYMTYVMFDQVFWRGTAGQINRWRRNTLGLPSTSLDKMEPHKIPFLYNFSPIVVPPPLDWPEWIRVTGYWFLDDASVGAKKWTPPPDLVEFIDSAHSQGKKVVYIGFGSIVVSDPKAMTRCIVDSIVQSGVHAILSKGWSDRLTKNVAEVPEAEEPLPKSIYPLASVPHDWLFKRIDAACHHGGAGTTGASLRAGIPTIIRPFFGDQFFWADRVEALGVGTGVRKLTVDSMAEALIAATTDHKQIDRAKLVGEQIRSENGVAIAIEAIYRDLEYARSLIRRTVHEDAVDAEDSTIREHDQSLSSLSSRPETRSEESSGNGAPSESGGGAPSEDWSVISDQDNTRSSTSSSRHNEGKDRTLSPKRSSLTAAVLSVLPDALTTSGHRRSRSASSVSTG